MILEYAPSLCVLRRCDGVSNSDLVHTLSESIMRAVMKGVDERTQTESQLQRAKETIGNLGAFIRKVPLLNFASDCEQHYVVAKAVWNDNVCICNVKVAPPCPVKKELLDEAEGVPC